MFPLWDVAIAPILAAAKARKVVEIGALRGENTVQILDHLGPDAELHVIDPVPAFDPEEHAQQFPGRYFFYKALSIDVLPDMKAMDAALIDGDHNWWTVYNECSMIAASATREDAAMPVMILHDVLWPYGRRDLYYDPSNVPEERRQPYARQGIRPGSKKLAKNGGLNPTMANALEEGGDRNGVMTGLEDFVKEYPKPLRVVVLPFYFGLAIVAEEERLEREPELAAAIDRLDSADARYEMLEVAESVHLKSMLFQHNVFYRNEAKQTRALNRYLDVVKQALLNEHYLENEARLDHLTRLLAEGGDPDVAALRDPSRNDRPKMNALVRNRIGEAAPDNNHAASTLPYTAMGRGRLEHLQHALDHVRTGEVPGDLVEVATGRGGGAMFMRAYLEGHEIPDTKVWVADRFHAGDGTDEALPTRGLSGLKPDLNAVRDGFHRFGFLDDRVSFVQGPLQRSLAGAPIEQIALLRIGRTTAEQVNGVLEQLYDRMADGGVVIVDEQAGEGVREAVEAFHRRRSVEHPLERHDEATVSWVTSSTDETAENATDLAGPRGIPVLHPRSTDTVDMSIVVVFYNMAREAHRTLQALSRSYQQGVGGITYEVIAIDNGSDPEQRLTADMVESFGPEFRLVDMGDDAQPSPVAALNRGIDESRGNHLGLMIDGAHVVTPGVIRYAMMAMRNHAPAIVATQQFFVGPGQQSQVMDDGYDEVYEDKLFEKIKWPTAGYRLFDIGSFIGERDWFSGIWESNCLFVPRTLLEQVGGFDESFDEPGGGYANLEIYERLGNAPDVTVCSMLGEGSFHQIHGGTTTNQPDAVGRQQRIDSYAEGYAALRGRDFKGPGKPLHFVGRLPNQSARRSLPRRLDPEAFADQLPRGGMPDAPSPISDDLVAAFTEAAWHTLPWRSTTWLGHAIDSAPTDLMAYQEIITSVRPDVIIETGASVGGRSLFLASMCDLVGHGRVIAIGGVGEQLPSHERLEFIDGEADDANTAQRVADIVGSGSALVVLGSTAHRDATKAEFERYESYVPEGSYVIVADTIVNGHPVWPSFGPGPAEGVKQIVGSSDDFVVDPSMAKYSLTFNPGGFLRRVASPS